MKFKYMIWGILFVALLGFNIPNAAAAIDPIGENREIKNQEGRPIWQDVSETQFWTLGSRQIMPTEYRVVQLDLVQLQESLSLAPKRFSEEAVDGKVIVSLPLPNGKMGRFLVMESDLVSPELAAVLPGVTAYMGQGIDDPTASVRFDITPRGFHGMILSAAGSYFIDPYSSHDQLNYIVYDRDHYKSKESFNFHEPIIYDQAGTEAWQSLVGKQMFIPSGPTLRTYRAAIGATGEYTQFHGGTVAAAQAAIVTTMNRVTGIYERETAISFTLVDNSGIVFANGATDPYTNDNAGSLINESQSVITANIGSANYDIGHVFSTGAGGLAGLGVVCNNTQKARGVTGTGSPVGDPYDVDYVAHEIGHQFGGNHTFNGDTGSCAGGNRNAGTAYEPGSGTTIQAYAGICAPQNVQGNSDDHFHTISFDEIMTYSNVGTGNSCPVQTGTGNNTPVPVVGSGGFSIPINTPFELTGSATDADGDPLVYRWEQFDLGAAGHPNSPVGTAPIFRSFSAVSSSTRVFPQISDILNGTQTIGEILPSYSRNLTFRMTALDYRSGGGGVDYATIAFAASAAAGPFLVTDPNVAESWTTGTSETVAWNVAGTTAAPVSCPNVDIYLSYDGGYTFPALVAAAVPNDGLQMITVPATQTLTGRVKVKCSNNIFFDLSNENIYILAPGQHILTNATGFSSLAQAPSSIVDQVLAIQDIGNATLSWTIYEDLDADCLSPEDVSWLLTSPSAGTTLPSGQTEVTVRFDSTGIAPGNYNAYVCISNDDVDAVDQLKIFPVSMEIVDVICSNYASTDVPVVIPATGLPLVSSDIVVPTGGLVYDVNVSFDGTHSWYNDLYFELQSPNASQTRVLGQSCAGDPNFDITLDDESPRPTGSWPCPPIDGLAYQPTNPLSFFDGQDQAGTWTLWIQDTFDADGGQLDNWSLDICAFAPAVTGQHIELSRNNFASTQYPDTVFHYNLGIYNPGDAVLTWNVFEDIEGDCLVGDDIPWLSATVASGTTNGGYDGDQLDVAFNSAGMGVGSYSGFLCASSDDVDAADQMLIIPITMDIVGALCTQYSSTDVGLRIPPTGKSGTTTSNLMITGGPTNLSDVNVLGLGGTHDRIYNLNFNLIAPSTTSTVLVNDATTDVCGNTANFSLNLDDAGTAGPISCNPLGGGGTWQPDGSLAAFNGENGNGNWQLVVNDDTADGGPATRGTGQLDSWGLELCELCLSPSNVAGLLIAQAGNDAYLAWVDLIDENGGYEVWRGANDPYFSPIGGNCLSSLNGPTYFCNATGTDNSSFIHVNGIGSAADNYFYAIVARNSCGTSSAAVLQRVGEFDYQIIPGS